MGKVTVVGSAAMDLTVHVHKRPAAGETVIGSRLYLSPGGKGANQAVAAARLGAETFFVGCIGKDGYGEMIRRNLLSQGVDVSWLEDTDACGSGTAHITLSEADGDNSIVVIQGANALVNPDLVRRAAARLKESDVVLIQNEIPADAIDSVLDCCRTCGVKTILNPAPAGGLAPETLLKATWVIPNEHELHAWFPEQNLEDVLKAYPGKVIVTLGEQGAVYWEKDAVVRIPSYKVEAIDTTGAGDTFVGALGAALSEGQPIKEALRFANAAAALSVQQLGAQGGMPVREEVEQLLKG
ncbi:ribokinase [Paenibacillus spiritus]|uniref:Ribokinase n=1 Tax=Paenibacillus spiritus TaxID=2496557 RepID=A0A5J5GHN1_9BACL|nr:ribokinase [Paenibacillus spiritus]KAA9007739.1 ribokinase [Paenibacillus spiritus]